MRASRKPKKVKKIKLQSKARIRRRLFKHWSEAVRERDGHKCIMCGMTKGDPRYTKLDAHHYLQRSIKDSPLKFDIRNGGTLCPSCHKFNGDHSAHKSPIVFYKWLAATRREHYDFVLENVEVRVDLDNRDILAEIERCLVLKMPLNIATLISIDKGAQKNENNCIGQPVSNVPGEQKDNAAVRVPGADTAASQADVPGME